MRKVFDTHQNAKEILMQMQWRTSWVLCNKYLNGYNDWIGKSKPGNTFTGYPTSLHNHMMGIFFMDIDRGTHSKLAIGRNARDPMLRTGRKGKKADMHHLSVSARQLSRIWKQVKVCWICWVRLKYVQRHDIWNSIIKNGKEVKEVKNWGEEADSEK